jgi:hypothetical protein
VISEGLTISDRSLGPYLQHSQERGKRWRDRLRRLTTGPAHDDGDSADQLVALLSEVLVAEMLTRVWTAVLAGSDCEGKRIHAEPIARHVLLNVLQTRARILHELLGGRSYPLGTLLQVDVIRRKCDRWTDLLIGELALSADVTRFAIDPARAREFRDHSRSERPADRRVTWTLLQAGLSRSVPEMEVAAETAPTHRGIVAAILSTLPSSPIDAGGELRIPSIWRIGSESSEREDVLPPPLAARLRPEPQIDARPDGAARLLADLLRRLQSAGDSPPGAAAADA